MLTPQTTRRNFLAAIALLSTEAALGSVQSILGAQKVTQSLPQLWQQWCGLNNAVPALNQVVSLTQTIVPIRGHTHAAGDLVYFPDHGIVAKPTWVHWGNSDTPADVVIDVFDSASMDRICRLNRFEMQALVTMQVDHKADGLLTFLEKNKRGNQSLRKNNSITARVRAHGRVHIAGELNGKNISLHQKLTHHT